MKVNLDEVKVFDNEAAQQYEADIEGYTALIAYEREGDQIALTHTETPPELEGQGVAGKLARYALDDARAKGLEVVPLCPYVESYIKRHQEYVDVVTPSYRSQVTRERQ